MHESVETVLPGMNAIFSLICFLMCLHDSNQQSFILQTDHGKEFIDVKCDIFLSEIPTHVNMDILPFLDGSGVCLRFIIHPTILF
jgi:hypothetical protein